ncbi:MAG: C4-type zinc ribbon domain-containing protein [Gordonia sp. (in: high G+C Gram-positive bacteria)]
MKVDAAAQRLLLDLADADAALARLDHRSRSLPEDAEIAELTRRLDSSRDDFVRADISAEDLAREYRRVEGEVTGMSDRERKDSALLAAGGLAAKALSELQHELSGLGRRRAVFEEELLSIMERQEAVEAERQRASATVAHLESELAAVRVRREQAASLIAADRQVVAERRAAIAADVVAGLSAIYERQRAAGKIGAGLLRARRCGACRMELDRGTLASIAAAADDEVIRCEECGAVLVRTAESGL